MPNPNPERQVQKIYKQIQRIVKAAESKEKVLDGIMENAHYYMINPEELEDHKDARDVFKKEFEARADKLAIDLEDLYDDLKTLQRNVEGDYEFRSLKELHREMDQGISAHREAEIKRYLDRGESDDVDMDLTLAAYLKSAAVRAQKIADRASLAEEEIAIFFEWPPRVRPGLLRGARKSREAKLLDLVEKYSSEIYELAQDATDSLMRFYFRRFR